MKKILLIIPLMLLFVGCGTKDFTFSEITIKDGYINGIMKNNTEEVCTTPTITFNLISGDITEIEYMRVNKNINPGDSYYFNNFCSICQRNTFNKVEVEKVKCK